MPNQNTVVVTKSDSDLEVESWNESFKLLNSTEVPEKYRDLATKSDKIRAMHKDGYKTGQIAKLLDIRYQHARNVIMKPGKKTQAPAA